MEEYHNVVSELNAYNTEPKHFANGESYFDFMHKGKVIYTYHTYSNGRTECRQVASTNEINKFLKQKGSDYRIGSSKKPRSLTGKIDDIGDGLMILIGIGFYLMFLVIAPVPTIILGVIGYFIYKKLKKRK